MDKPLSEWTLAEVKSYCSAKSECKDCIFWGDNLCEFRNTANLWQLNKMVTKVSGIEVSDKPAKPRLAEVLGVEVGERFTIFGYAGCGEMWIDEDGFLVNDGKTNIPVGALTIAVNRPENLDRVPRLTEAERIFLQGIPGVKWVSRDVNADDGYVDLWGAKPELIEGCYNGPQGIGVIGRISSGLCISVHPGDCIEV